MGTSVLKRPSREDLIKGAGEVVGAFVEGIVEQFAEQLDKEAASGVTSTPEPEEIAVPPGYILLPAGPTRYVGVNSDWLKDDGGEGGPFRVENELGWTIFVDDTFFLDDVQILGPSRLVGREYSLICGTETPGRSARVQTTAALLVKAHKPK